jgi:hypothetical protein
MMKYALALPLRLLALTALAASMARRPARTRAPPEPAFTSAERRGSVSSCDPLS